MVTAGNVIHHQSTPAHLLYDWLVKNGRAVLNKHPRITRGIWLVTKTYSTDTRAVALLTGNETTVTLNVNAQALGQGNVTTTAAWWNSQKSEAWNVQDLVRYDLHLDRIQTEMYLIQTAEGGLVLAMDGLWCEHHWYTSGVKPVTDRKKQTFLGGAGENVLIGPVVIDMQDKDDTVVEFIPEIKGKVPGVEIGEPAHGEDEEST